MTPWTSLGSGSNGPLGGSATVVTGDRLLSIPLSSLLSNPTPGGWRVSDIEIALGDGLGSEPLISSASVVVTEHADGTFDVLVGPITQWSGSLDMSQVMSNASGPGAPLGQSLDLTISPVRRGGGFDTANSAIGAANPFVQSGGTFNLVANGLGPTTLANQVTFGLGGVSALSRAVAVQAVPEPMSIALLGSGLIGLALMRYRRKRG